MRRISLWALSTLSTVVLLLGYRTSLEGPSTTAALPSYSATTTSTAGTTTGGTTGGSTTGGSTGAGAGGGDAGSGGSGGSSTVTGSVVQTQWGPVQVQLTVDGGGAITGVDVLQYPSGNGHDQEINAYALPVLVQETLDAQSAEIDMVSGATVTSQGYLGSLQDALDQAGL
ncbi:FMN-binding protein [Nocardioides kribbensis]|uniref:FMN-binding protein n=1 Tax=Nocardioides kribbensis TaxID=305517 RepID=A0ABV1NZ63_9ACTN|nr:FMN-binding protein [Nocardioides kribbensis]